MSSIYVTGFANMHTITKKYQFKILNAVYLKNAQSFFHAILHCFTVIQGNSFGVLFNGLLAELPVILDSFYQYHKWLHRGSWLGVVGGGNRREEE